MTPQDALFRVHCLTSGVNALDLEPEDSAALILVRAMAEGNLDKTAANMTLRDWFAGRAMQALQPTYQGEPERVAWLAFQLADAMLAERTKGTSR